MVDYRNENSYGHIITIGTPVEYVHPHRNCIVTQREVGVDTDDWGRLLKNTLRQAPDVILIGEIRDREPWSTPSPSPRPATCARPPAPTVPTRPSDRIINFFPAATSC